MNEIYMPKENIIFRGMSLANGEWEYGFVNVSINGCWIGTTAFSTAVDRETVGQWSGLRDRQGVPIINALVVLGCAFLSFGICGLITLFCMMDSDCASEREIGFVHTAALIIGILCMFLSTM